MRIVWDEPKRRLNLAKHGLDFADLEGAFEFTAALMVRARRGSLGQLRLKAVGAFRDQVVTVVFAPLGTEAISIIASGRRAREERMTKTKRWIRPVTDEEEARIQAGIAQDPDNPELTDEELANLRPAREVLPPDLYEAFARKARGPQVAPTKQLVSLRLDPDVIAHFKAQGAGWQTRINKALRKVMAEASGAK